MRTLCIILTVVIASFLAFSADTVTTTNALCFYVISEEPIAEGRYIDTPDFPKLGYISNAPSYMLARLQEVRTNDMTRISAMVGKDEKAVSVSTNRIPTVQLKLFPADSESFADFTRQNIHRRVLLTLGDKPLMAPMVRAPIESGSLQLDSPQGRFPTNIIEGIQGLVQH